MRLLPVPLAALALLTACADPEPPAGAWRFERPRLRRERPLEAPHRSLSVQELAVPAAVVPWTVEAPQSEVVEREGELTLQLRGEGLRRITIPGTFDPREFTRVLVHGVFLGQYTLRLQLDGGDGAPFVPKAMVSLNQKGPQSLIFDLTRMPPARPAYERLVLEMLGPSPGAELHGIELVHTPPQVLLPDPEGEGTMLDVIVDGRHAWGLAKNEPLVCEFEVRDAEEEFVFAVAGQDVARLNGRNPRVVVRLDGSDGETSVTQEVELENTGKETPRWHDTWFTLAPFVGQTVTARFNLRATGDAPAVCALGDLHVHRRGAHAPTVLLISSDTHRADHLGHAGMGVEVRTPALDALAARGTTFLDAWSSTNVTSPSHATMLTAVHPRDSRILSNTGRMAEHAHTLAEVYRAAGYWTLAVVSVRHLGPRGTGLGQGFDRMITPVREPWSAEVAVDMLEGWLEQARGKPIFVWFHVFDAHEPYLPPGEFDRRYYPADKDPYDPDLPDPGLVEGTIPRPLLALRDLEFPKAQYRAEVDYIDSQLARILTVPRFQAGLVAFTGDHGEILEKDGTYFNHGEIFPDTLHVPLILAGPDVPAGLRTNAPVEVLNIGRTLLDVSGLAGTQYPGRNLLADLRDENALARRPRFALSAHGHSASVTLGGWHLMLHLTEHKGTLRRARQAHETELYDLSRDPECLHDLDGTEREKARELAALLLAWLRSHDSPSLAGERAVSAEQAEMLAAMGYAPGEEEVDAEDTGWVPAGLTAEALISQQ
jgi:arylsulfatase A-like enzyme